MVERQGGTGRPDGNREAGASDRGVKPKGVKPKGVKPKGVKPKVEIFDPPLCCPTGVCGPEPDPALLDINEAVMTLKAEGVSVERYSLNAQPQAFVANPEVYQLVRNGQLAILPITVVDARIVKTGAYPSLGELRELVRRDEPERAK